MTNHYVIPSVCRNSVPLNIKCNYCIYTEWSLEDWKVVTELSSLNSLVELDIAYFILCGELF